MSLLHAPSPLYFLFRHHSLSFGDSSSPVVIPLTTVVSPTFAITSSSSTLPELCPTSNLGAPVMYYVGLDLSGSVNLPS
ncbi:hypothetical protein U1Q18_009637, partial [Sarracenia purpurea var. burkii]